LLIQFKSPLIFSALTTSAFIVSSSAESYAHVALCEESFLSRALSYCGF